MIRPCPPLALDLKAMIRRREGLLFERVRRAALPDPRPRRALADAPPPPPRPPRPPLLTGDWLIDLLRLARGRDALQEALAAYDAPTGDGNREDSE